MTECTVLLFATPIVGPIEGSFAPRARTGAGRAVVIAATRRTLPPISSLAILALVVPATTASSRPLALNIELTFVAVVQHSNTIIRSHSNAQFSGTDGRATFVLPFLSPLVPISTATITTGAIGILAVADGPVPFLDTGWDGLPAHIASVALEPFLAVFVTTTFLPRRHDPIAPVI